MFFQNQRRDMFPRSVIEQLFFSSRTTSFDGISVFRLCNQLCYFFNLFFPEKHCEKVYHLGNKKAFNLEIVLNFEASFSSREP